MTKDNTLAISDLSEDELEMVSGGLISPMGTIWFEKQKFENIDDNNLTLNDHVTA